MPDIAGRLVVLAGATSTLGHTATRALVTAGARVVAVSRDAGRLAELEALGARAEVCDLEDPVAVDDLKRRIHLAEGGVDGVIPLVGGWRGGGGIAAQSDEDYRALETSFTVLRNVSRAFDADLRASSAGRLAIISSRAVARPLAGGANYVAVKAASEAWVRAVAQGFAKAAREADEQLRAAATIFRVKSLEGVEGIAAQEIVNLWESHARYINDRIIDLDA
ncbi:SDR family NAD(P)-dependent oxidoreductase [Microbacterium sp. NIBRBAC000506063]|uniref:SDR family NAD(P)-dependent oxidoreductase n=1 Tax=Microbacterium sp. NIBRBAC000506063 TaxID=2734618 RepID=UPI001BB69795|nr:SDR family oxidoreductase [Microbacterium sp. NIBRBAC000506063]QTV79166.1 SDR family oxidoreductase [Microbacterium sp. NIBRBAC000506063]